MIFECSCNFHISLKRNCYSCLIIRQGIFLNDCSLQRKIFKNIVVYFIFRNHNFFLCNLIFLNNKTFKSAFFFIFTLDLKDAVFALRIKPFIFWEWVPILNLSFFLTFANHTFCVDQRLWFIKLNLWLEILDYNGIFILSLNAYSLR